MEKAEKEMTTIVVDHGSENTLTEEDETEHITPSVSPTPSPEIPSEEKDDSTVYDIINVAGYTLIMSFQQLYRNFQKIKLKVDLNFKKC